MTQKEAPYKYSLDKLLAPYFPKEENGLVLDREYYNKLLNLVNRFTSEFENASPGLEKTEVDREVVTVLCETYSLMSIAYLTQVFPDAQHARVKSWDETMVREVLANCVLQGDDQRELRQQISDRFLERQQLRSFLPSFLRR